MSALPPILAEVEVDVGITVETPVASVNVDTTLSTAGAGVDADADVAGVNVTVGLDVGLPGADPDGAALVDLDAQIEAAFAAAADDPALGVLTSPLNAVTPSVDFNVELNSGTLLGSPLGSTVTGVLAIPAQTLGGVPLVGDAVGQVVAQLGSKLDRASGAVVTPLLGVVDGVVDGATGTILSDGQLQILGDLAAQLLGENVSLSGLQQLDLDLGLAPEAGWEPTDLWPAEWSPEFDPPAALPGDSLEGPLPVLDNLTGGAIGGRLVISLEEGTDAVDEVPGQAGEDEFVVGDLAGDGMTRALEPGADLPATSGAEDGQPGGSFSERGMSLILAAGLGAASVTDSAAELAELAALAAVEDLAAFDAALEQFLGEMSQMMDDLAAMGGGLLPWMLAAVTAALGAIEIVRRERRARLQRQAASLGTIGAS